MGQGFSFQNVTFHYEGTEKQVIKGMDLHIEKGQWVSVVGPNGSGKSTMAKLMNGLLLPTEGSITFDALSILDEEERWAIRNRVGMVFQNPEHQFVATKVRDDLAFGMENRGFSRDLMLERIETVAKLVGIDELLEQEPHRLSGGQKQRVAIAGILAIEPEVIIFDEATSMLDPSGRKDILKTMQMLHERGITLLSITHDVEEAVCAERVLVLDQGQVAMDGPPQEVFQNKDVLSVYGLDVPFSFQLQEALAERGIELGPSLLTEREVVEALWTLKLNS
ncbi:energy-coupling factor transporter ATPase [Halalkalibacterium ligniniphilum]|uniref:energy-coupling factor transporter ATPase n=1 Tax=Halalkalibacterium ligniniphilum TaxID=1134413 RepID=UPI00034555CE|nr:energy-coupling factor transporter ATPase [Halalkalibacterium ligniniphilum]